MINEPLLYFHYVPIMYIFICSFSSCTKILDQDISKLVDETYMEIYHFLTFGTLRWMK